MASNQMTVAWGQARAGRLLSCAWRVTASRAFATWLLAGLGLVFLVSLALPQQGLAPSQEYELWRLNRPTLARLAESLLLTNLRSAWWFLGGLALLATSCLVCTTTRTRQLLRRAAPLEPAKGNIELSVALPGEGGRFDLERGQTLLARMGYRVRRSGGSLYGQKGVSGSAGSLAFHFGLVLLFVGGALSGAGRFSGLVELAPGQSFAEKHGSYLVVQEAPFFGERHRGFEVFVERIEAVFWPDGTLKDIASAVAVVEEGRLRAWSVLSRNEPLHYRGITINQGSGYGPALRFTLTAPDGKTSTGYVNLAMPRNGEATANRFKLPDTPYYARAILYAEEVAAALLPDSTGLTTVQVALIVTDGERQVAEGRLMPGGESRFEGYSLSLDRLEWWSTFIITSDPGYPLIVTALAITLGGLAMALFIGRRQVWVHLNGGQGGEQELRIVGRAQRYPSRLRREMKQISDAYIGEGDARD